MEVCVTIAILLIAGPLLLKLFGSILRGLGPLIAILIGLAVVVGGVALTFTIVRSLIEGAASLIFGPVGLLLLLTGGGYLAYREWNKRQTINGVVRAPEKRKRSGSRLEIGDDGEIVTLDELMDDEDTPKRKRGG